MKIKYVGVKQDGETAFAKECGRERWLPGASQDVADAALCARMLRHDDVFAQDTDPDSKPASLAKAKPADPLHGMDDAAVREFARAHGLKVQALHLLKADKLRAKVTEALARQ